MFYTSFSSWTRNSIVDKGTFKEVINDTIDTERRMAANSALWRNRNTDYLKIEKSTNNKNNKTT